MTKEARDKALLIGHLISMKKAHDMIILDVKESTSFTDYFVISSGRSIRQVQAIASYLEQTLKKEKLYPLGVEGLREGSWVLMDYGDVVVHLFYQPVREFYNLEDLWSDAEKVTLEKEAKSNS